MLLASRHARAQGRATMLQQTWAQGPRNRVPLQQRALALVLTLAGMTQQAKLLAKAQVHAHMFLRWRVMVQLAQTRVVCQTVTAPAAMTCAMCPTATAQRVWMLVGLLLETARAAMTCVMCPTAMAQRVWTLVGLLQETARAAQMSVGCPTATEQAAKIRVGWQMATT